RVRRHEPLEAVDGDGIARTQLADGGVDPEQHINRLQLRRTLARALGTLPRQHREIIMLRDYQELSYAEIAEKLAIPLGTVMSRLHTARKRLRELCDGVGERGRALTG
ncbi:MAG: sigma-70 family RNA polymerase sigma factor, partial [Candidatus Competibacteraceae bacterium]|nr:sigma-70 family RNA polymerase sigma factor [Candidatus Competibacteraceae bacterium]